MEEKLKEFREWMIDQRDFNISMIKIDGDWFDGKATGFALGIIKLDELHPELKVQPHE